MKGYSVIGALTSKAFRNGATWPMTGAGGPFGLLAPVLDSTFLILILCSFPLPPVRIEISFCPKTCFSLQQLLGFMVFL